MINIFNEAQGEWMVWIDTDGMEQDGTCIGVGKTKEKALVRAIEELKDHIKQCEDKMDPLLKAMEETVKE